MKAFHYVTLTDMMSTIRKNIYKIPHDIDFVIGVPRSGMIVASVVSEFLNVPLVDIDSFISGQKPTGGHRLELFKKESTNKVLVVDDTTYSGKAMYEAKFKLKNFTDYEFIYCVAYKEGPSINNVDVWFEDNSYWPKNDYQVLYEWNMFNHYPHIMSKFIFDIDGVFCTEDGRPDDCHEAAYEEYIKNAKPYLVPKVPIGAICTYRINKYKEITEEWLKKNGIRYGTLVMFNADTWQQRNTSGISPEKFKSDFYKSHPEYILFIESNDREAQRMHQLSGKQVLCTDTNRIYG